MTLQMENTVNEVTDQFRLPDCAKTPGLSDCFGYADDYVAFERVRVGFCGVVEGDDISRADVVQKMFVQGGNLSGIDEVNAQLKGLE